MTTRNSSVCSCNCCIRFTCTATSRQISAIWPSTASDNSTGLRRRRLAVPTTWALDMIPPTAYPDSVARSPDVPFRTERHSPVVSFLSSARGGRRLPHRVSLSAKGGGADDPRVHWFTAFLTFLPIRTAAIKVTIHHSTEAVSPSSLEGTVQCRPHTGAGP